MRKLFYVAFVALVALLVVPGAVSAGTSDTITVTGNIGGSIDVTVSNDVSFGDMSPGNTYENTAQTLSVTSTYANWAVNAADQNTDTGTGHMLYGTTPLTNAIQIKTTSGSYAPLDITDFFVGTSGTANTNIGVQQQVVTGDQQGAYSITIVFTGGVA